MDFARPVRRAQSLDQPGAVLGQQGQDMMLVSLEKR